MLGAVGSSAGMVSVMMQGSPGPALLPFSSKQLSPGFLSSGNCNQRIFFSKGLNLTMQRPTISSPGFLKSVAATAAESNQLSYADPVDELSPKKYYFLIANAKFMFDEEEHFKEQLFERLRYYGECDKEQDFWLVIEPKFLDKFPNITKRLGRPAVALVSTNGPWITFMKLRLDRVLSESFEADSLEEALASNPAKIEFEKPEKWVAPYPKYEYGWWETFLPKAAAAAAAAESKV
ncbi:hypothetical protein SAY87_025119 [Trapa incisa]|uniref:Ycf54 n=1 Tax=Trapa incisa TaxID=236973 RepID=A0AAN7J965_9MYRT|nr:hypothetical protein SAY87_025119 [Trapa incisa]